MSLRIAGTGQAGRKRQAHRCLGRVAWERCGQPLRREWAGRELQQFRKNPLRVSGSRSPGAGGSVARAGGEVAPSALLGKRGRKRKEFQSDKSQRWRPGGGVPNRPVWKHLVRKKERLKCRQSKEGDREGMSGTELVLEEATWCPATGREDPP